LSKASNEFVFYIDNDPYIEHFIYQTSEQNILAYIYFKNT